MNTADLVGCYEGEEDETKTKHVERKGLSKGIAEGAEIEKRKGGEKVKVRCREQEALLA